MAIVFGVITIVTFIGALLVIGKVGEAEGICNYGQVGEDNELDR